MKKKFRIQLVYESEAKYIFPFDIVAEVLELNEEDIKKIEDAILLELSK